MFCATITSVTAGEVGALTSLAAFSSRVRLINQAMGLPKGREAGARYLTAFIEEMKASGFVAQALARHGIEGAAVAPPGP